MPETMRAVAIRNGTGPATSLYIRDDAPNPTPTKTQALVKVKAFGLNRMDLLEREGKYPVPPQAKGLPLGVEFAGTIEGFGNEAEQGFKKGDEVFGLAYGGAYAEYIAVSTHMLVHKPKELSWEECAGIPETWITALQALYLVGGFTPHKSILWHAGASAVSIAGIQLSLADSASAIYCTARQDDKLAFCVDQLGATAGFNTASSADWADELLAATDGRGVDIVVDFLGASAFAGNLKAVARDGRIVNLASLGGAMFPPEGGAAQSQQKADLGAFVRKRIRFEGSSLRSRDEEYQGRLRDQLVEHALPKFREGKFKVYVERVMDWERVVEAHQLMESNQTKGKIVCTIG